VDDSAGEPRAPRQLVGGWDSLRRIAFVGWHAGERLIAHEGFELSGYAAFTALLSLFPFLLFLTALAGFFGDAEVARTVLTEAFGFAPREVVDVLRPVIFEVLTQRHGSLLTLGIVFALWSASSGLEAMRTILNRSYGLTETRAIWLLRPQSIVIVMILTVFTIIGSVATVFAPLLLRFFEWFFVAQQLSNAAWVLLRYGLAAAVVTAMLIALHLTLPNRHLPLRAVWPGAVITALLWFAEAGLFSIYVENFANFSITYGSLGGIILTLLFFYVTAILFAYGAEVNAALLATRAKPALRLDSSEPASADTLAHEEPPWIGPSAPRRQATRSPSKTL